MCATSILQCRPNSHPFPDRTLILGEPVKIGRSVARARPAANNAIFDCKVLSRNHALLWYENGKFFLKDTKSSNGTFVNNYRLSKGSEESSPQEVCSGDIVQFGVDVMENSKKGTVTHGCIIATLKLYLPDGQEAKASSSTTAGGGVCDISSQELFQLRTSLQEAQHRERLIESKLSTFQQIVVSIQEAASQSWTAMIDEDRLLQRLEMLEDQLATYAKNCSEDAAKEEIRWILEEKNRYETSAKESFQRILEEKVEASNRCVELERSLSLTKTELNHKKETAEMAKNELEELLDKQSAQTLELRKMAEKLKSVEDQLGEKKEKQDSDRQEWEQKIQEKNSEEKNLLVKIEVLKAENDFTKEQLNAIKSKYENIKNGRLNLGCIPSKSFSEFEFTEEEVKKTFQMFRSALQALHDRLWQAQEELQQTQSSITQLKNEAESAAQAEQECQAKKAQLQDELCDKKAKEEANMALIEHLRSQIEALEARLEDMSSETPKIMVDDIYGDNTVTLCRYKKNANKLDDSNKVVCKDDDEMNEKLSEKEEEKGYSSISDSTLTLIDPNDVVDKNNLNGSDFNKRHSETDGAIYLKEDINKLKETLSVAETSKASAEAELERIREELANVSVACLTASHEAANLHHQLAANEAILLEKTRYVGTLQEIGGQLESSVELIYSHLIALTQRISLEKQETLNAKNDNEDLKEKLKEAELLSEESISKMEILRAKFTSFEANVNKSDESSSQVNQPHLVPSSSSVLIGSHVDELTHHTSSGQEDSEEGGLILKLRKEIEVLQKSLSELKTNRRMLLKDELDSTPTDISESDVLLGTEDEASLNTDETVRKLRKELHDLLDEHHRLKDKFVLCNSEFADLTLQNKMSIPTWLMLILVIPLSFGWQWLCECL